MKMLATTLLITLALSGTASAQQRGSLTLGWDDCRLAGATNCQMFACNTNSNAETHDLVGCYVAGNGVTELVAWYGEIDVAFSDLTIPPWWRHGAAPACRGTDDLTVGFTNSIGASCLDYQSLHPTDPVGGQQVDPGNQANHSRIRFVVAFDSATPVFPAIPPGTETYLINVIIRNGNTVSPDAVCSGCTVPALLTFAVLEAEQRNGDNFSVIYQNPLNPAAEVSPLVARVSWQGADGVGGCQAPTPARNQTWGSIKAIYR